MYSAFCASCWRTRYGNMEISERPKLKPYRMLIKTTEGPEWVEVPEQTRLGFTGWLKLKVPGWVRKRYEAPDKANVRSVYFYFGGCLVLGFRPEIAETEDGLNYEDERDWKWRYRLTSYSGAKSDKEIDKEIEAIREIMGEGWEPLSGQWWTIGGSWASDKPVRYEEPKQRSPFAESAFGGAYSPSDSLDTTGRRSYRLDDFRLDLDWGSREPEPKPEPVIADITNIRKRKMRF